MRGADQKDMTAFLNQFRKMGGLYEVTAEGIRFTHPAQRTPGAQLKPIVFETNVHPGFMTDWQQPLVVALTQAKGASIVHETVYEERFRLHQRPEADGRRYRCYARLRGRRTLPF